MKNRPDHKQSEESITPSRPENAPPFPDEERFLADLTRKLEEALAQADSMVTSIDREYMAEKRYMAQYRGEIDPHEMFQNELALTQIDRSGAFAVKMRDQMIRMKSSPYFARIDFRDAESREASKHYIGTFAFRCENELLICDWRSPIASMFYDCEVGPASYAAPVGRIEGELTRKRQFKIRNGKMEYVLETSVNIQDDVLQRELSRTSDEKMKSIIATIQKEQNQIIRNETAETLILQGVAGSGKTSIALHRIAYLLYRFRDRLSAKQVAILSPNKVFGDYISNVLPELGEEPIFELRLSDLAEVQLAGGMGFEPDRDPLENDDEAWAERVRFKSTLHFVNLLDRYLEQLTRSVFQPTDYNCGGFTVKADLIQSRFDAYAAHPVRRRLQLVAEDLHHRLTADPFREDEAPKPKAILKSLHTMLRIKHPLALYQDFYRWLGRPDLLAMPSSKTLEWSDVFPFLYLQAAFDGLKESGLTRHLVIDEMQDYTPVQFAVLNRLFKCPKTILGDYGQRVNPYHLSGLEELRKLYGGADFVMLNKSYRSTCEIIRFAKRINNVADLEPVARHGDEPQVFRCGDGPAEIDLIRAVIASFEQSGFASLGIIVKTNREAESLYEVLARWHEVHLLSAASSRFSNGISVTSVQMSKGLEFDEVLIPGATASGYASDYDRCLLYIACTRAMHRLTLTCQGEPSHLFNLK